MNPQNKKLVIFDFDGVLAETIKFSFGIHKKVNPNFTWEYFQELGMGNWVDNITNARKNHTLIKAEDFDARYKEEINKINISEGVKNTILELHDKYIFSIVSSNGSQVIGDFLKKEKMEECFSDILGADVNKDKTIKIKSLLDKYNILKEDAIFVTDSLGDIKESNECKVKSIGVTWGIHTKEILEKGNPIAIIDDSRDLLNCIQNVLK